jgi:hypothetical protein
MTALWITLAAVPVIAVITVVALVLAARKHAPEILAAQREFFTATGYQHPELPGRPVEEQIQYVPRRMDLATMAMETRYVRPIAPGEQVTFRATATTEAGKRVHRQSWRLTLAQPPTALIQIADRDLSSLGKAVREAVTRSSRTWSAVYSHPVTFGDPALDARFVAYSPNPAAAQRCLATPALRQLLLACEEVDLIVSPTEIALADPADKNLKAARGGTAGRVGNGLNPAPSIRASIPVHQRMNQLLEQARAATA